MRNKEEVLYDIINNIIYTIPTILFYLLVSYLVILIAFSDKNIIIKLIIKLTEMVRTSLFFVFGLFSDRVNLIRIIHKIHTKKRLLDINVQLWTNTFSYNTSPTNSGGIGTTFRKKLDFVCYIDFYTNELCLNLVNLDQTHYSMQEKRVSISKEIPFKDRKRLIDSIVHYHIDYNIENFTRDIEEILNMSGFWTKIEQNGLNRIYTDQINGVI